MRSVPKYAIFGVAVAALTTMAGAQDFSDVTAEAGLIYTQHAPFPGTFCQTELGGLLSCEPERMTGGAAVGDYDGDGWDDLFVTRFHLPPILYHNNGDGTFSDVSEAAGIPEFYRSNAAIWADIDNDSDLDLIVGVVTGLQHRLLINDGAGKFTEEAGFRGIGQYDGGLHLTFGIAVGDYDGDGWLDIFTAEWGVFMLGVTNPRPPHHSRLYRNRGAEAPGFFVDVTDEAGVNLRDVGPAGFFNAFAPAFVDLDQDGHVDLAIASDFGEDHLYWNNGDGTFTYAGTDPVFTTENGMGSTFGDYDSDGDLDWFITSIAGEAQTCGSRPCNWGTTGNRLYRNDGNRSFSDVTDAVGLRDGLWGWGASFFDFDNNGLLDLVMTNGAEFPANLAAMGQFIADPMRFWVNQGDGTLTERAQEAGITDTRSGKGLLHFDYDRDGDLDIFVVNNAGEPVLYRNDAESGDFLRVRFLFEGKVVDLLNAKVWVTRTEGGAPQYREVGVSSHFLGQSERTLHFGLGEADSAPIQALEVQWPLSGNRVTIGSEVLPNTVVDIEVPKEERIAAGPLEFHSADYAAPKQRLGLSEVLRVVQIFRCGSYGPGPEGATEDGFIPMHAIGKGPADGHHSADYNPADWVLSLGELLRVVQLYNAEGYLHDSSQPDGFLPIFDTSDRRFSEYGCRNAACT